MNKILVLLTLAFSIAANAKTLTCDTVAQTCTAEVNLTWLHVTARQPRVGQTVGDPFDHTTELDTYQIGITSSGQPDVVDGECVQCVSTSADFSRGVVPVAVTVEDALDGDVGLAYRIEAIDTGGRTSGWSTTVIESFIVPQDFVDSLKSAPAAVTGFKILVVVQ